MKINKEDPADQKRDDDGVSVGPSRSFLDELIGAVGNSAYFTRNPIMVPSGIAGKSVFEKSIPTLQAKHIAGTRERQTRTHEKLTRRTKGVEAASCQKIVPEDGERTDRRQGKHKDDKPTKLTRKNTGAVTSEGKVSAKGDPDATRTGRHDTSEVETPTSDSVSTDDNLSENASVHRRRTDDWAFAMGTQASGGGDSSVSRQHPVPLKRKEGVANDRPGEKDKYLDLSLVREAKTQPEHSVASDKNVSADTTLDIERRPEARDESAGFVCSDSNWNASKKTPKRQSDYSFQAFDRRSGSTKSRGEASSLGCLKRTMLFAMSATGLCLFLCLYCVFGAGLFIALEAPGETKNHVSVRQLQVQTLKDLWQMTYNLMIHQNGTSVHDHEDNWLERADKMLQHLSGNISTVVSESKWDPKRPTKWTFTGSLLFAVTVITTIGFGNLTPVTPEGRFACMLYGLFGVPLTLLCLAKVGNAMAKYLKLSYSRVVCRPCTDQNEEPHVPLFVCVGLVMAYLFLGAELFCYWEGWDLMDAVYFCFTSLITVGFGDMLPGSDLQEENRDAKTVVCIAYLLLGLGLLAMCCVLMKQDCVNVTLRCGRCLVVAKPRRLSHTAASAKARGDHRA